MEEMRYFVPLSIDQIPCPFHYAFFFTFLGNHEYWLQVYFTDLAPGDIFCYLPPNFIPEKRSEMPTTRTGTHVGIIEKVIRTTNNSVELVIIDCTRFPHCQEDSRTKGGIGRSPLTIYIERDKTFLQWGSREKLWQKEVFFGRLKSSNYLQGLKC